MLSSCMLFFRIPSIRATHRTGYLVLAQQIALRMAIAIARFKGITGTSIISVSSNRCSEVLLQMYVLAEQ